MISVVLALAANSASIEYFKSNDWTVFKNEDNCAAIATYERNTALWITYDAVLQKTIFIIIDPALKSVRKDSKYKLKLYFVKGESLDDGWGEVKVSGIVLERGDPGLRFVLNGSVALTDVASSDALGLFRDDVVVESLTLKGSAEMVPHLRSCAREMQITHPTDPLEGADETQN